MTTRGKTIKTDSAERQVLLRPMVTRRYELRAEYAFCCGCSICQKVCPREAIKLRAPVLANGRLVSRPQVDIDPETCSFCGECVVLCPTHALGMTVNGANEVPVLKGKVFPLLIRTMKVDQAVCESAGDDTYIARCPAGAISGEVRRDETGQVTGVADVQVDRAKCLACTHCMEEGPTGAFTVVKPYHGRMALDTSLCPPGCQACADVCPSDAITYDGERVYLDRRFCLFCSACENVCPVPGAVRIWRTGYVHTPIESGAWARAVEKLVSYQQVAREYDIKSQGRRRKAVLGALLPEMGEKKSEH
jgi:4Fe-4S ferredoxin